jgi:hypothetical protein
MAMTDTLIRMHVNATDRGGNGSVKAADRLGGMAGTRERVAVGSPRPPQGLPIILGFGHSQRP